MRNESGVGITRVSVPVPAGGTVTGTLRLPDGGPAAAVVIHPATAVAERLYTGFAEYLAENGFAVFTYDYRGTGASGSPKTHRRVRVRDWMEQDVPAVAAWMRERFPHVPQLAVGHSVGAHAMALDNGLEDLRGFVAIASHAGVSRAIPDRKERLRVGMILGFVGPLASRVFGYCPSRRMGLGEDMPAGVMLEWSGWSKKPNYFFDDPSMHAAQRTAKVKTDALVIGFTDDPWATPGQIDAIFSHLVNAPVQRRTYSPADAGVPAIGHMGFFRRGMREKLWPEVLTWLTDKAGLKRQ